MELSYFVSKDFKNLYPEKELWIYTGYKYEEIIHQDKYKSLLKLCDIIENEEFRIEKIVTQWTNLFQTLINNKNK